MKRKYYLYTLISAVSTFLLSSVLSLPVLSLVSLVLFLHSLNLAKSFKSYLKISATFFVSYYFLGFSFLLFVYKLIDLPVVWGVLISFLATILTSVITSAIHILPTVVIFRFSKHRITDAFLYAAMFSLGEYLVSIIPLFGCPLISVSLSVTSAPALIQIADLFGSCFLTFIIVAINSLFACIISTRLISLKSVICASLIVLMFLSTSIYGVLKINYQSYQGDTVSVAAVQTDLKGLSKLSSDKSETLDTLSELIESASGADMIFLPETAIPYSLRESSVADKICALSEKLDAEIFSGIFYSKDSMRYNAYCAFSPSGTSLYLKSVLVPFGEFSLFGDKIIGGSANLSSAESIEPLEAKSATVAVGICIESIYPSIIRKEVKDGGEIIAIPTNDSWFFGTHLQKLHFRHSILISVENFRYTVRCANSGISAIISPFGQVTASLGEGEQGVITASVSLLQSKTLYTEIGNMWIAVPVFLFFMMLFFNFKQTSRIRLFKLDF
ncbi:MAG: apolipoprotein N-acyltransferase [Ruminococcus sp.]|nr:apolipoprotein N-acyltransferase [Ruminococcus sp.]